MRTNSFINLAREVTGTCITLTDHSLSCSLVERPSQRQGLGKMFQLQQTVDPLDTGHISSGLTLLYGD